MSRLHAAPAGAPAGSPAAGFGLPTRLGVRIAGTGVALPADLVDNAKLAETVDTNDEWIRKRTGIAARRVASDDDSVVTLGADALRLAMDDAGIEGAALDLVLVATMTGAMSCPSSAARVAAAVGAKPAGAMDVVAACSGYVYALNLASTLIESGRYRRIGIVGAEVMTRHLNFDDRRTCVLFGDGAGAAVLERVETDGAAGGNPAGAAELPGCVYQSMGSDGDAWEALYLPRRMADVPDSIDTSVHTEPGWNGKLDTLQMEGREVFKFAVVKICDLIDEALDAAGLDAADLKLVIPHQSNRRIMATAQHRFGLPEEKLYINIDRFGNTSAASVAICLDEVRRAGRVAPGDWVLFIAIGGGMSWGCSLWRM